jgi:DNA-binding transcriptional ArsR family regulator
MLLTANKPAKLTAYDERLIFAMQLLGDKTRYKIFKLLVARQDMCVSQIAQQLNITVSAVSQHFRNFEQIGLVHKERTGQKICYMLKKEDPMVKNLIQIANK